MYSTFRIKLSLIFFLLGICAPYFYADDLSQVSALEQVREEIERAIRQKGPSPIQTVLKRYKVRNAVAVPGTKHNGGTSTLAGFLSKKRPVNVTSDEWQALKRSNIALDDAENDARGLTLLDLDEDGRRDLIVESYTGGTGLFTSVSVYRRSGKQFISDKPAASTDESPGELYSINGRGSDQAADWIRVNGRVYLAYRNGEYGQDELLLMRAFSPPSGNVKGLIVEYDYRHTLLQPKKAGQKIKPALFAGLQKGLTGLQVKSKQAEEGDFGQCPAPANLPADKQEEYVWPWFGPGHYSFDVVADFPVFEGNRCYAARLISFKSSYFVEGIYMSTSLWLLRKPGAEQEDYEVHSVRFPQRVRIAEIEYPLVN